MRRTIGFVLFIGGGLAVSFAGAQYALGAARQDEVRRKWDEQEARAAVSLARSQVAAIRSRHGIVEGSPVARLVVPKLGMDEIVVEGVSTQALNAGPGHYPGSAFPGEAGNAIISAHRDRHFSSLGSLSIGDTIETESGQHSTSWVVISKRVVGREAPALFRSKEPLLTLTTCWPIRYFGSAPDRLILTAKPIG